MRELIKKNVFMKQYFFNQSHIFYMNGVKIVWGVTPFEKMRERRDGGYGVVAGTHLYEGV